MHCPKCQSENEARARFCSECGTRLEQGCPACGAANALASKFCQECGQPLGALRLGPAKSDSGSPGLAGSAPLREERRWATLLFADLSGFTTLSEKMDPEDVKALAHRCTGRLSEEVRRFGRRCWGSREIR